MDINTNGIEDVTISDILELATWNRPRTDEELHDFVTSRHARLVNDTEIA